MASLRRKAADLVRDPEKGSPTADQGAESDVYGSIRPSDIWPSEDKETSATANSKDTVVSTCETLDQIRTDSIEDLEPPPDGGWQAWSVCKFSAVRPNLSRLLASNPPQAYALI